MTHKIKLDWYEQLQAGSCGLLRHVEAGRQGYRRTYSSTEDHPMTTDIDAAGGELAVSKLLNKRWRAGVNTIHDPDVGDKIEVRHTRRVDGRLIVRKNAPDDRVYVLVRGTMPNYEVVGWIKARDAKRAEWLRNPHNDGECYMVPEDALIPFDELNEHFEEVLRDDHRAVPEPPPRNDSLGTVHASAGAPSMLAILTSLGKRKRPP